ncbi:MAG: protein kinase [Chloroflexota bacterium]
MSFTVGENVGPYRIIEQLGQGGMATVYKAYHAALDRYVALKVLHPDLGDEPTFAARFQREARLVAKLEHPHIVPVHDFAVHEKHSYLVMKFIEGETLKARLGRGPLRSEEVRQIVDSVGSALAYAHEQGILHRDVKPSNVLITTNRHTYLADFGLARIAQAGESTLSSDAIIGTPQYISPEQAIGQKDLDEGTDIYSFGVMLYEMVVGQVPFSADTPFAIIHDHIYSPLPLPRVANPAVPEAVERVLLKSLAKERADRYKTVNEMVAAFKSAWDAAGVPIQGTGVMLPKKSSQGAAPVPGAQAPSAVKTPAQSNARAAAAGQRSAAKRSPWSWISIAAGAIVLLCCFIGFVALLPGMLNGLQSTPTETALPTQTATALPSTTTPRPISTPIARDLLFADDFSTLSNTARAVFSGDMMSFGLVDGRGYLASSYMDGVMPAMYYGSEFGDMVMEFDFQAPDPKVDSQYGFVFRSGVAQDGTLDWYYLVGFAPTEGNIIFACWLYDDWSVEESFMLPSGAFKENEDNHVVLEARGADFRVYLNNFLVLDQTDSTIENPGAFGFYIVPGEGSDSAQDSIYFDDLQIYSPPAP